MTHSLHGNTTNQQSPRKHIVPTHLNLPDQVLTVWSFSLTARQLLLLLVGAGIGGTVWQHLSPLSHAALVGQVLRGVLALTPFFLVMVLACYRHAGRYLEVWLIVLAHYSFRPKRYLWRSIRADAQHLSPRLSERDAVDKMNEVVEMKDEVGRDNPPLLERRQR